MRPEGICNRTFQRARATRLLSSSATIRIFARNTARLIPGSRHCLNQRDLHGFLSARATRTAVMVIALSAAGLWALRAMDAKADPPPWKTIRPAPKGAPCSPRSSPISRRASPPNPAGRTPGDNFADAMRASAGDADRACAEEPPRPLSVDAGERLKRMERHAAAMQAMFGAMANAYVAIAPNLTTAQRDILSRNIVPPRRFRLFQPPGHGGASRRKRRADLRPGRGRDPTWGSALGRSAALIS